MAKQIAHQLYFEYPVQEQSKSIELDEKEENGGDCDVSDDAKAEEGKDDKGPTENVEVEEQEQEEEETKKAAEVFIPPISLKISKTVAISMVWEFKKHQQHRFRFLFHSFAGRRSLCCRLRCAESITLQSFDHWKKSV